MTVKSDGRIVFSDEDGNPVSENLIERAKREKHELIHGLITDACTSVNAPIEALSRIHLETPDPSRHPTYQPAIYSEEAPQRPIPSRLGLGAAVFRRRRERVEAENAQAVAAYDKALAEWQARANEFYKVETARKAFVERQILEDAAAMAKQLEETLGGIAWPRETQLSFDIREEGRTVVIDVDLPEVEDMPTRKATVPSRGLRLGLKDLSSGQVQKMYQVHVHAIGFRIIGETFAALPAVTLVVLSAFTQRPNKATGVVRNEYLYSVRVPRNQWEDIDFNALSNIDVIQAIGRFELRRAMTKGGVFAAVEPFDS